MPQIKRKESNGTAAPKVKKQKKRKSNATNGDHDSDGDDFDEDTEQATPEAEDDTAPTEHEAIKLEGSMLSGELLIAGGTNWDLTGRRQVPTGVKNLGGISLWAPHRFDGFTGKLIRTVVSGPTACHSVIIDTEGKAYTFGRNDKAQLGHGDTKRRDIPTIVETLADFNIVDAACGRNHTLFLTDTGTVFSVGDNKMGQLGLGNDGAPVPSPTKLNYRGPPVRRVAAGAEFSLILDVRGDVWSFGHPEYGQLGHNSNGEYFVTSNKLAYHCETKPRIVAAWVEKTKDNQMIPIRDRHITDIACGVNHWIAVDSSKRVYTCGFGGYGRLGHAQQKDEMIPRLIKFFDGPNRGVKQIYAGSQFTMAVNEHGCLFLWGQNKPTGECAMYPKPVQDLSGWEVRSIGCGNRSIVCAADDSVVCWGPSPTFGELGLVDKVKSSTQPKEVKLLGGMYIHKVACGYGHTLYIARNDTDEEKKMLEDKVPLYTP